MPSPVPGAGRGRTPGTACAFASSSSSCTSSAQAAPASSTSARNTRWSPATAPVWAAAASAPAGEEPTFRTVTPTPRSAHSANASQRRTPSPSASRYTAIEPTPSSRASWAIQSAGSTPAELPHETTVWSRSPRLVASVLTATFPLCETSATRPGSSGLSASPQSATRSWSWTMPLPLGPQTGRPCRRAAASSSRSSSAPLAISPKPAP